MIFKLHNAQIASNKRELTLRCPACRQLGTFASRIESVISISPPKPATYLGHRVCPNPDCRAHVFVAYQDDGKVLVSYPPQRIDFDSSSIPEKVRDSLEEALTCHANNAFVGAAILVRRTLEALCEDVEVAGKNLKDRLANLGKKVVLPSELLSGLDNLRLLGNDAAHVEAQVYNQIGEQEVEVAIDVAKEVLKALYQYKDLVARLEKLKVEK